MLVGLLVGVVGLVEGKFVGFEEMEGLNEGADGALVGKILGEKEGSVEVASEG